MSEPLLTVPNQLTILRMGLAPFLALLVLSRKFTWALVVFVTAGLTDLFDGYIARHGHQKTQLGAVLDPIADKILMTASFLVLTWGGGLLVRVPVWVTVLILSRDLIILVAGVAITLTVGKRNFEPSLLGKTSTACQIVTAGAVLLLNAIAETFAPLDLLFVATAFLTVASAAHYAWRASTSSGGGVVGGSSSSSSEGGHAA